MFSLSTLTLCVAACLQAGVSASGQGQQAASFLQARSSAATGSSQDYDFFDDVPNQVLQQKKGGGHSIYLNGQVSGEALTPDSSHVSSSATVPQKSMLASLLAAKEDLQRPRNEHVPSQLKALEGFHKKEEPVDETADDPRPVGFARSVMPKPASDASRQKVPSGWDLMEYARAGANAALSNAFPRLYQTKADETPKTSEVQDGGEVDHSAEFSPGAASILTHGR